MATQIAAVTLDELRSVDLFDGLDDASLALWLEAASVRDVAAGDVIAEQDTTPAGLQLLLSGTARSVLVGDDGRTEPLGTQQAPTWMGAIAVITGGVVGVRMLAGTDCRVGMIPAEAFMDLALQQRSVHAKVMAQISPVTSRLAGIEQNRERLASLGTMAAGLAHELNNPAAAAKRAAAELADALDVLASTLGHFVDSGVERAEAQQLVVMQREALEHAATCTPLSALDAADREDELVDVLEDAGVQRAWQIAEPLAQACVDAEWVARAAALAGPATQAALEWVAASLTARTLATELASAADQMSRLVGAVKSYAYMDRGDVVEADVHEGLETTLIVLGHKLKVTEIAVERDYDRTLPALTMRGSELNQVWTNLIDNAIAALGSSGTITLATKRDGEGVCVVVADDGPGIDATVQDRIFDPFFTTKGVGEGTGLGLDTARRIVVDRHHGTISVHSSPGSTRFAVWLPFHPPS